MRKILIQLLLLAFCLGIVNSQYPGQVSSSGYGLPSGYENPGYGGSVGLGSNALGSGVSPGGAGISGVNGISGSSGFTPDASSSFGNGSPNGGSATGNPNSRIFGLLTGGGLFGGRGRGGGLLSNLFGGGRGNSFSSGGGYPIAYPVPVASPGFGGFGGYGGGFPSYGGGFYG